MNHTAKLKPVAAALGSVFAIKLLAVAAVSAAQNPFVAQDLGAGYQLAESKEGKAEGKCGEGKCGASRKTSEGKCGEGKCGAGAMDTDQDGKLTKEEFMKAHEEMFANMDANSDGAVDADEMNKAHEGKCGEGKCGVPK